MEFSLESQGIQSITNWKDPDLGIYEEVITGIGETEYDAAEDAIDLLCNDRPIPPDVQDRMENMAQDMDDKCNVCTACDCAFDGSCDGIEENPDCDMTFVVALYVRW
jgi:hypothetical protein